MWNRTSDPRFPRSDAPQLSHRDTLLSKVINNFVYDTRPAYRTWISREKRFSLNPTLVTRRKTFLTFTCISLLLKYSVQSNNF